MSEAMTPDAERQALVDMIQSDGWAVYVARGREKWGASACEQAVRDAMAKQDTAASVPWILATFEAMRADLRWPEDRIAALAHAKAAAVDTFAEFRRVGLR